MSLHQSVIYLFFSVFRLLFWWKNFLYFRVCLLLFRIKYFFLGSDRIFLSSCWRVICFWNMSLWLFYLYCRQITILNIKIHKIWFFKSMLGKSILGVMNMFQIDVWVDYQRTLLKFESKTMPPEIPKSSFRLI